MCIPSPSFPTPRVAPPPAPPVKTQDRPLRPDGLDEAQTRAARLGTSQLRIPLLPDGVNLPQ